MATAIQTQPQEDRRTETRGKPTLVVVLRTSSFRSLRTAGVIDELIDHLADKEMSMTVGVQGSDMDYLSCYAHDFLSRVSQNSNTNFLRETYTASQFGIRPARFIDQLAFGEAAFQHSSVWMASLGLLPYDALNMLVARQDGETVDGIRLTQQARWDYILFSQRSLPYNVSPSPDLAVRFTHGSQSVIGLQADPHLNEIGQGIARSEPASDIVSAMQRTAESNYENGQPVTIWSARLDDFAEKRANVETLKQVFTLLDEKEKKNIMNIGGFDGRAKRIVQAHVEELAASNAIPERRLVSYKCEQFEATDRWAPLLREVQFSRLQRPEKKLYLLALEGSAREALGQNKETARLQTLYTDHCVRCLKEQRNLLDIPEDFPVPKDLELRFYNLLAKTNRVIHI